MCIRDRHHPVTLYNSYFARGMLLYAGWLKFIIHIPFLALFEKENYNVLCGGCLLYTSPYDSEMLDNILELIVETVCTKRPLIRIGAEERPAEIVQMCIRDSFYYFARCPYEKTDTTFRSIPLTTESFPQKEGGEAV